MNLSKKTKKTFDCVRSKRQAQARIYRKIKGMGSEQEIAYFDDATRRGPFAELWQELIAKGHKAIPAGKLNRRSA